MSKRFTHFSFGSGGKEPWQITAARFCVERGTFSQNELESYIVGLGQEQGVAEKFFTENVLLPFGTKRARAHSDGNWFAPTELVTMVMEYDELKELRRNSLQAWHLSLTAIIIGATGILVQIVANW